MSILKTVAFSVLRVFLVLPLMLLYYVCEAFRLIFGCLSDGFVDMAKATREITHLPYIRDIEKKIEHAKTADREALLRNLKGE